MKQSFTKGRIRYTNYLPKKRQTPSGARARVKTAPTRWSHARDAAIVLWKLGHLAVLTVLCAIYNLTPWHGISFDRHAERETRSVKVSQARDGVRP
jgi:hypothetical protein